MRIKCGVVTFPGTNSDFDLIYVLEHVLNAEVHHLWHKEHYLNDCQVIFLPGGFSYGDYLRSGAIARISPIMKEVVSFANKGGIVIGICNGFQILTESNLLPGALINNININHISKDVFIRSRLNEDINVRFWNKNIVKLPISHTEGQYYCDQNTLDELVYNEQIMFQYCDSNGNVTQNTNPNGSINNIAGICNKGRNVIGMMPHPERASDKNIRNTDGIFILQQLIKLSERVLS